MGAVATVEPGVGGARRGADGRSRGLLLLTSAGFFLSGMAGLIDEVVWSKALSLFIGGTTAAHTIVLATFMGGLALGNMLFGRVADQSASPLKLYAFLELGVGLFCVAFPELFDGISRAYLWLAAPFGFGHPVTVSLKFLLAAVVVILPTILMGGTLPVLARVLVRDMDDVTVSVGRLYFINSLGAVFGTALAGFWLVPALGLDVSIRASGAINLLLAPVFLIAARSFGLGERAGAKARATDREGGGARVFGLRQQRVVLIAIAVSGACSMLYELVWIRLLSLVMGSSTYSFSIMLVTFISGITLGSLAVSRVFEEERDPLAWFVGAELGIVLSILPVIPIYDRLPYLFASITSILERGPEQFGLYLAVKVLISFVLMFLPTFFIGMTLPLASRVVVDAMSRVGRRVGSVFSFNTVGTVVGSVLTGLVLIPWLELRGTLSLGLFVSACVTTAVALVSPLSRRAKIAAPGAAGAAVLIAVLVVPAWNPLALHFGLFRHKTFSAPSFEALMEELEPFSVVYARDGRDTSVAVIEDARTGNLYMKVNGKTDAGTGQDMTTQLWLGHLGMLLHPAPARALVIGLGSGITAGAVLAYPGVSVDVVEISEAVVEGARWFEAVNRRVLRDPRATLYLGDAKELFNLKPDARYDVVISEPSNPWISGIGNLFSVEYFEQIAAHLGPNGLLVQWVHLYELNDELLGVIFNTLSSVFPVVEVWQCNTWDVLVVAAKQPLQVSSERIAERLTLPEVRADLDRPALGHPLSEPLQVLANQALSAARFKRYFPGRPPFNRDRHPILEYEAPRAFFAGQRAEILWRLDERRLPVARARTPLAARLTRAPASADEIEALARYLEARGGPSDLALLRSLAWAYRLSFPADAFGQGLFKRFGDPELAAAVFGGGVAAGERLLALAAVIEQATSNLYAPNVGALLSELRAALEAGEAALQRPETLAFIWYTLARVGACDALRGWAWQIPKARVSDPGGRWPAPVPLVAYRDFLIVDTCADDAPAAAAAADARLEAGAWDVLRPSGLRPGARTKP
jgi:spermidine synthase